MGIEVLGFFATIIISSIGGLGWIQDRSGKRIDSILKESNTRVDLILTHVRSVERTLNDIRAEMPLKYTLREDHIRLSEKVDGLDKEVYSWRHKEVPIDRY